MASGGFGVSQPQHQKDKEGLCFWSGSRVEVVPLLQRKDLPHVAAGMQTIAISNTNNSSSFGRATPHHAPLLT